jgi:hypothetical protein
VNETIGRHAESGREIRRGDYRSREVFHPERDTHRKHAIAEHLRAEQQDLPDLRSAGRAAAMVPNIIAIDARTKRKGSYTARPDISASSPKH